MSAMTASLVRVLLAIILLLGSAFQPMSPAVVAQPLRAELDVATGRVTLGQVFIPVRPFSRDRPLRIAMNIDPLDNQELRHRAGFYILDESRLRAVQGGASPSTNNIAAGTPNPNSPVHQLVATIVQPEQPFTVVVFNDTSAEMFFRLTAENGAFDVSNLPQEAPAPAESAPGNPAAPSTGSAPAAAIPDVDVYIVEPGDSVSLIAQKVYGDLLLYDALCAFNGIVNCDVIEVGDRIATPPLAVLTGTDTSSVLPSAVVQPETEQPREPVSPEEPPPPVSPAITQPNPGPDEQYKVMAGDTLGVIAQAFLGDFNQYQTLCVYNGLVDCNILQVGQILRIPSTRGAVPNTESPADTQSSQTQAPPQQSPQPSPTPPPAQRPSPTPVPTVASSSGPATSGGSTIDNVLRNRDDTTTFMLGWDTIKKPDLLKGNGPFTVFAPTDDAFDEVLLENSGVWFNNHPVFENVLAYHVIPGYVDVAIAVANGPVSARTMNGESFVLARTASGTFTVGDANVIGAPIRAGNGLIYLLDKVLTPP